MRIFICYASEDTDTAQHLAVALRSERVGGSRLQVFCAEALEPSADFVARIRAEIKRCDLFLFLISRASVQPGFTHAELRWIQERWPTPHGRVVGVRLDDTPDRSIPPYVRNGTLDRPAGNVEAETRVFVQQLAEKIVRRRLKRLGGVALIAALGLAWSLWSVRQGRDPVFEPPPSVTAQRENTATAPDTATRQKADTAQPAVEQETGKTTTRGDTTSFSPDTATRSREAIASVFIPERFRGAVIVNGDSLHDFVRNENNDIRVRAGRVVIERPFCRRTDTLHIPAGTKRSLPLC